MMILSSKFSYLSLLLCFFFKYVFCLTEYFFSDVMSYSGTWFCNQLRVCSVLCLLSSKTLAAYLEHTAEMGHGY